MACNSGSLVAEVVVIANKDNLVKLLTKKQVIDIYMGRTSLFPDGQAALPIDQETDSPIRKLFYRSLVNKTVNEINAYWARLIFSGRATPPQTIDSAQSIIEFIKDNKAAIAYIRKEELTDDVKVVTNVD
jgi:ABC-type phosphate transport system substrate-binding protein